MRNFNIHWNKWFLRLAGLLALLAMTTSAMADEKEQWIEKANQDYSNGLYNNAIENYNKVLDSGYESAELYFNLGNACFKTNDLASAILYYEKAKRLRPNDEDIIYNLRVANGRIADKIEEIPLIFYKRWWNNILTIFDLDTWAKINISAFILFLIFLSIFLLSKRILIRKSAFWTGSIVILIFIFALLFSVEKYNHLKHDREAIVFDPSVTVKSSPTENSIDLFVVHEGTKVRITENLGEWYEIRIANGSIGWIPKKVLRAI